MIFWYLCIIGAATVAAVESQLSCSELQECAGLLCHVLLVVGLSTSQLGPLQWELRGKKGNYHGSIE